MAAASSSPLALLFSRLFTRRLLFAPTLARFSTQLFVVRLLKLRVAKGQPVASAASQPSVSQSAQLTSEYDQCPHPAIQQIHVKTMYVPKTKDASAEDYSGLEDDGELKSM